MQRFRVIHRPIICQRMSFHTLSNELFARLLARQSQNYRGKNQLNRSTLNKSAQEVQWEFDSFFYISTLDRAAEEAALSRCHEHKQNNWALAILIQLLLQKRKKEGATPVKIT